MHKTSRPQRFYLSTISTLVMLSACVAADEPSDELAGDEMSWQEETLEDLEAEDALVHPASEEEAAKRLLVAQPEEFIDPALREQLRHVPSDDLFVVDVFLARDVHVIEEPEISGSVAIGADERLTELRLNGTPASERDLADYQEDLAAILHDAQQQRNSDNRSRWEALAARYGLDEELADAVRTGSSSAVVALRGQTVSQMDTDRALIPVRRIDLHRDIKNSDGIADALASVEISTHALPFGWNGGNVGVWMNDGNGRPIASAACVDPSDLIEQDYGNEPLEPHATLTLCLLQAAAPAAKVHYGVPTQACNLRNDVTSFSDPKVLVSSQSNSYGDNSSWYDNCSRDWDNFVYDTRIAHFALTQNTQLYQGNFVRGAAKAYNVFSIGSYNDSNDTMASDSNWGDPNTGAHKPEFVAPGVGISIPPYAESGTSLSTPIAAGFAADLLDRYSFLRFQPALLKAYLLVRSVRVDGNAVFGPKDGAGRLDFSNTGYSQSWFWNGSNSSWFTTDTDGDGRLEKVVKYTLYAGQTYNVATSWLVDGDYVRNHNKPNMDIDLQVQSPGGSTWKSNSSDNSHELISFTAPTTGVYTFKVERYWNSGQGNVSIGLVVKAR